MKKVQIFTVSAVFVLIGWMALPIPAMGSMGVTPSASDSIFSDHSETVSAQMAGTLMKFAINTMVKEGYFIYDGANNTWSLEMDKNPFHSNRVFKSISRCGGAIECQAYPDLNRDELALLLNSLK